MGEETPFEKGLKALPELQPTDEVTISVKDPTRPFAAPATYDGQWVKDLQGYWRQYEAATKPEPINPP